MKKLFLLLAACVCMMSTQAAYLKDIPVTKTQPDGSVIHCFASGDEFFNYLHDANGYTIMQHPQTGYYVYADKQGGKLVATNFVVGKTNPSAKGLLPYALISPDEWMARRKAWEVPEVRPAHRDREINHGTLNNISIFIRFSDDGEFTNTYSSINNMFNDESTDAISLVNYFKSASYNAINIPTYFYPGHNGETIISYQDTYPKSYFQPYNASTNPNGYNGESERTEREFSLLERAVNYVNANYPVPTTINLDYDEDGLVDNVCFIVKGDVGGWNSLLWPHKWALYGKEVFINAKRVWTFNFQLADAEAYFNTSTMCHEMNHSLGAPDLYHYYYGTNLSPVGPWDLMENNTTPPQHCGAYMKMKYGHWIDEIPEITQAGTYTLNPISSATPTNIAYKIASDDPNQYYVLEYRNSTSLFESGLPGSGLLIYRIDTRFDGNASYDPSNGIYDEVYLFRPGGTTSENGSLYSAYFSSNVGRTEFSSSTNPYPFLTDGSIDNNFRIYNITSAGNTISFTYGSSSVCEAPTNVTASVEGNNVILSWDAAANAVSYNIYRGGTFIGNTSGTTYTDSNVTYGRYNYYLKSVDANGLLSPASETVTVTIAPEGFIIIGDGSTATNDYLPSFSYYKYSLTQQIYTADEIGTTGSINSIAFYNGGAEKTRTYDFYLKHTTKSSFSGTSDWESVSDSDKVFSGSVTMTADDWTIIELDTPFAYNGTSNLLLVVDDNSGAWTSDPHMSCRVFDAPNQAIRIYSDDTDYNPNSPSGYSGVLHLAKNQILLNVENGVQNYTITATANPTEGGTVSGGGTYEAGQTCTLTATPNEGYSFMYWTENSNVVSNDAVYAFTVEGERSLTAHFSLPLTITAWASPEEGGTVTGAGEYNYGTNITLSATPAEGWYFYAWKQGGSVVSTDRNYSLTVTGDADFEACFVAMPEGVYIGDHSTGTNQYLPTYTWYCYSFTEQIYTADEIGTGGLVSSLSFFNIGNQRTRNIDLYLVHTDKAAFEGGNDWIAVTEADRVFSGEVTFVTGDWTTITLDAVFAYDGISNLAVVMDDNSGYYESSAQCRTFGTSDVQAIRVYSDYTDYNPADPAPYGGALHQDKNQMVLGITPVPTFVSTPRPIDLGYRPNNAWMRPFALSVTNTGSSAEVTGVESSNDYFTLDLGNLVFPFTMNQGNSFGLNLGWGTGEGLMEGSLLLNHAEGQSALPMQAMAYTPGSPDVFELALNVPQSALPFLHYPSTQTTLYDNYYLPGIAPDGYDAVYKLTFEQDTYLSASVVDGEDGKVALYTEDFKGFGGPDDWNYYSGPEVVVPNFPFESMIGDENSDSQLGYFPFYTLYNYSIAECLFHADELLAAGVNTTPMTSLSWYANNETGIEQQGISIWMANVSDDELTYTSHTVDGMTLVYTGTMAPYMGWNEFVFNEGNFAWDGMSNLLILCQRNNGAWNSTVYWRATNAGFNAVSYRYQDSGPYDVTVPNTMYTNQNRPNIILKAGDNRAQIGGTRDEMELTVYEGEATNYRVPAYVFYFDAFTKSQYVIPAEDLAEMAGGSISSLKFYTTSNNVPYTTNNTVDVFLMEVDYTAIGAYEPKENGTIVYQGVLDIVSTEGGGEVSINFSTPYTYGGGNLLVGVENPELGGWRGIYFCGQSVEGASIGNYNDNSPDDVYPSQQNFIPKTTFTYTPKAYGVVADMTVTPGTYYLVASSTSYDFGVEISAGEVPCPDPAYNPTPENGATEIQANMVNLKWKLGERATEYRFLLSTNPEFDPNDSTTIFNDWTRDLADNMIVYGLNNNTVYYWRIDERVQQSNNSYCTVEGEVWSFTTHLNTPMNLCADDETVFVGNTNALHWSTPALRGLLSYNIYQDGELIANTTANNFDISGLSYNLTGYLFTVTALYDEGESTASNAVRVKVSGNGTADGFVYEQDGETPIANATVSMEGNNEFGEIVIYSMTTGSNGYYSKAVQCGTYSAYASGTGYQMAAPVQGNPRMVAYAETTQSDFVLDEQFTPVAEVTAEYYPDANDPNSPYAKVSWSDQLPDGGRSFQYYRVYRTSAYNNGPFIEANTAVISEATTDNSLIDNTWEGLEMGTYKYGVSRVYEGNRESAIRWGEWKQSQPINAASTFNKETVDFDPNPSFDGKSASGSREMWDLMMTFNAAEVGQYGVAYDGNNFYTSNWGYTGCAYNFYKYDLDGNMLEGFNISGCGTLRGMTYDGQYFYGVANSSTIYCVDLANKVVVNTITSAYGAMRAITYDPVRDGFWVVGNWSGNLTLVDRTGAIVHVGPEPSSASDCAYYKDENNVEHVYCFNNADNGVYDYNITTNTLGGSVFNFSNVPGYDGSGGSGGCHVGNFNGKVAFIGDIQQEPNLIGIYELHQAIPGVQVPRESEITWSNFIDKGMWTDGVSVSVTLNSGDSPEGALVSFVNMDGNEQASYPVGDLYLDETGTYAWDQFRKGEYTVTVSKEGYETVTETVSIYEPMTLQYELVEIIVPTGGLYVSHTGWAMWDGPGNDRHFETIQVILSDLNGNILSNAETSDNFMQLPVESLVDGQTYHLAVQSTYSSGNSDWAETDWVYKPCDNYEGATDLSGEPSGDGLLLSWTYPGVENQGSRAMWNLMMTFNAAEGGQYGLVYDGTYFYTSNWGYSGASNNFYKYDSNGNVIEGFNILGCGTLRGMTYDGEYVYGVANSSTIYCVDMANKAVVNTITSAYGAMRAITYDPVRDGFWVVGNWSGNLTLVDRTGAIVQVGPEPASVSDCAYYKDENDVEHVFCFNNADNGVYDYNITTNTLGGSVFNFSSTPGYDYDSGTSGGCHVGSFNGKMAFMGDIQQSPNLIGIYELQDSGCLGAMIFANGDWVDFVPYPTNSYEFIGDASAVSVRMVYYGSMDGEYYSMSCPQTVGGASSDITQTTSFNPGWTWWSTYIEQEGINGLDMLKEAIGTNGLTIKSQNQFVNYNPNTNKWTGSLKSINNESAYMINMSVAADIALTGTAANPADHPITLKTGWSWIGYPTTETRSVGDAMSNITPSVGDQVKSQGSFATYNGTKWNGSLKNIEPGKGYMYKSNNSANITLIYPSSAKGEYEANITAEDNYWVPNMFAYPTNMTMTAVVELDEVELTGEHYELAAFANGECRGSARLMEVDGRHIAFMTISGEEATELYFGLYDAETGTSLLDAEERLNFEANATLGELDAPIVIHFRGNTGLDEALLDLHVYPNPVNRGEWVSIALTDAEADIAQIEVINALGVVVETVFAPTTRTIEAPNTAGIYTLRITTKENGICYRKLVVK